MHGERQGLPETTASSRRDALAGLPPWRRLLPILLASALCVLSCEVPEPQVHIDMLADREFIDESVDQVAVGVMVRQTLLDEVVPMAGAEVVFEAGFIMDTVILMLPESDPFVTDENGITAVGLNLTPFREALAEMEGIWVGVRFGARVVGTKASVTMDIPVTPPESGGATAPRLLPPPLEPGRFWKPAGS